MKSRTTLCTLMCILLPLSAQALPSLSHIFPCLRKHTRTTVVHIPAPTLAQRCLKFSKTIAQSKITKAAVATTILCICAKKAWDYVQSWRAQLRSTSDQLKTERIRKQELERQATTQTEQLAQAQQQAQEYQQKAGRLAEHVVQLQQEAALSEESHKVQLQNTQQALEALQSQIDSLPLRAYERLNAQAQRLTTVDQRLQQLKDALAHKVKATRSSSTQTGKSSSESSSHPVRAQGRHAPQPLSTEPASRQQGSRINPKIKPDIPHIYRDCAACKRKQE